MLNIINVHIFIKTEGEKINGHVKSLTYRPSPAPSGDLEISLQLTFTCDQKETLDVMNSFINSLYDCDYTGMVDDKED